MGWTSFRMKGSVKDWFKEQWNYSDSDYELLDSALVQRSTLYGVIKQKSTGLTFCAVFLIRWSRDYYNFSYKDMTEFSGPCQSNCPQKIMKQLSPLNDENDPNGYAREWRKRVEKYWEDRNTINSGGIIKTENPVSFTSGDKYQYFQKIGRKTWAGILVDNKRQPIYFHPMVMVRMNFDHFNFEKLSDEILVVS